MRKASMNVGLEYVFMTVDDERTKDIGKRGVLKH